MQRSFCGSAMSLQNRKLRRDLDVNGFLPHNKKRICFRNPAATMLQLP